MNLTSSSVYPYITATPDPTRSSSFVRGLCSPPEFPPLRSSEVNPSLQLLLLQRPEPSYFRYYEGLLGTFNKVIEDSNDDTVFHSSDFLRRVTPPLFLWREIDFMSKYVTVSGSDSNYPCFTTITNYLSVKHDPELPTCPKTTIRSSSFVRSISSCVFISDPPHLVVFRVSVSSHRFYSVLPGRSHSF